LVDASLDVRYVALSYAWGGVKQVMLNKTSREFLNQVGSIMIPQTIRDAIRLCQLLGERCLWKDSLCIMQDEEYRDGSGAWTNADKMAQIPRMDIIYGASALTVIAACGADSNTG
ncbi:heterokaryon incompatibility, partial [Lentithecium fluviatile CBS 122367]